MDTLNLPPFAYRLGGSPSKPTIFDELRRRYVALTPEEWVRQHFVHYIMGQLGYPRALLANEVELRLGSKRLRCDTVVYDRSLHARMIIEYKQPSIAIEQKVFDQISAYNLLLHVDYLVVSNGIEHYACRMDYPQQRYEFLSELPRYDALVSEE